MRFVRYLVYPVVIITILVFLDYLMLLDTGTRNIRNMLDNTQAHLDQTEQYITTLEKRIRELEEKYDIQIKKDGQNRNRQTNDNHQSKTKIK